MLLLGLILYLWQAARERVARWRTAPARARDRGHGGRALHDRGSGYMAGTQNYGRTDYQLGDEAHHACGKEFPTCNGDFMPFRGRAR